MDYHNLSNSYWHRTWIVRNISLAKQLIIRYAHFILNPARIETIQSVVPEKWENPLCNGPAIFFLAERTRVRMLMLARKDTQISNDRSIGEPRLTLDHLLSMIQTTPPLISEILFMPSFDL